MRKIPAFVMRTMKGVVNKYILLFVVFFLICEFGVSQVNFHQIIGPVSTNKTFQRGNVLFSDSIFGIEVIKDVTYCYSFGYYNSLASIREIGNIFHQKKTALDMTMDIYRPKEDSIMYHPTILFFHGGGFFFDNKESHSIVKWCKRFAARGYNAVAVNYRLSMRLSKEEMKEAEELAISDAFSAIRFLVIHKDKYQIDVDNLFLAGTSAGAMISLQLPLIYPQQDFTIRAIAEMWGAVPDTNLFTSDYPSLISFHGGNDGIVSPYYDCSFHKWNYLGWLSKHFVDKKYGSIPIYHKLGRLGVDNRLYFFPLLKHKLHWDMKRRTENEYFYFIDERIADFFLEKMVRNDS